MKLFQKLLLAPAAIGFFSPVIANASEANLMDVSSYSQVDVEVTQDTFKPLTNVNPLLAGGEGLGHSSSDFDGDTFSSTTSAAFTADTIFGATNGVSDETTKFIFQYGIELTTSFTGNDSLDVVIESGNAGSLLSEADFASTAKQELVIDSISYTTLLGERLTLLVGTGTSGSALYAKSCAYQGVSNTMDDCGVAVTNLDEGLGTTFAGNFDLGAGFSLAFGLEAEDSEKGLLTDEGTDAYGAQIAYTADNYGVAIGFSSIENHGTVSEVENTATGGVTTSTSISAYLEPDIDNIPSISVGFESTHDDNAATATDEFSHYFLGIQWDDFGEGILGAAVGSKAPYREDKDAETMYEIFYAYNYADGITITPAIYVKENAANNTDDETGLFLKTSFSF